MLCVRDHDRHHRPGSYHQPAHVELGEVRLREWKNSWEAFVAEARKPNPHALATINMFGTPNDIHSAKLILQWPDGRIEFEKSYHLLVADVQHWADDMLDEVTSIGHSLRVAFIEEPLPIIYCPCGAGAMSSVIAGSRALPLVDERWSTESACSIYVNPRMAFVTVLIVLGEEEVFLASIHRCNGNVLHYWERNGQVETVPIRPSRSVRTQVTRLVEKRLRDWHPARVVYGTGPGENPTLIDRLELPKQWERPRVA